MKHFARILFVMIGVGVAVFSAYATDQMRTTEIQVADSASSVSTAQNYPFTLFIGDDLTDVTAPAMKSMSFVTSGVYTGSGTVTFTIDSDGATSKAYTLPNVGSTPTPFEIEYKDPSSKISPTSGGSYGYTLNFTPSGVTIYGLGIKMSETHRYKPPTCADGAPANQKVKSTESAIADSASSVSTAQNYPFTLFIGDDLTDVTAPAMKSMSFTTSGVYTGSGTVTFTIDSDGATSKAYTLPNVGSTPTPFEIEYKDPSSKISPTSGGSYGYTLNFTPSGVTIYGLGIKMSETHRYKPPTCGGMPVLGDLTSAVFDSTESAGHGAGYNSVMWKGTLGGPGSNEGKVRFQFSASDASTGPWTYIGGDTCASGDWFDAPTPGTPVELKGEACQTAWNNKRYFRYKIRICSNNCTDAGTYTPTVNDVVVSWAP
ncbi:MAG: hypothetical protein UW27_C0004G0003 [Parcubacteria group bacterium GW2011_GWA1_44_13]|uniref:Uncharacterized protein n=1 Tax=Candidatus Nomurabacteria bacterium GW2011_GWB1_44_12 TaxID=1618748 RepID=A0A837ICG9_9BACT|nr:MAG: hypothetical protein UW25_C0005G0003 [Candidatus Nomurabacteria bacterium GW2011_GWB1_44_12]KKT38148.1 MAG: hypothetical protein UW27_C0004G0003 [Parcubacteria group bacterium GW2011_GWA1_44_13]HBB44137.1 hypothetical protein [Candidatus Yonathbacteria bacterium]